MKPLQSLFALLLLVFAVWGYIHWLTSSADKSDYEEIRKYIADSPEAKKQFANFLANSVEPASRWDLIQFRIDVKPVVVNDEIKVQQQ